MGSHLSQTCSVYLQQSTAIPVDLSTDKSFDGNFECRKMITETNIKYSSCTATSYNKADCGANLLLEELTSEIFDLFGEQRASNFHSLNNVTEYVN